MWLARTYLKMNRDTDAYRMLAYVVHPPSGSYSSEQDDSRVLAYYGDLCARLGKLDEARAAYRYAFEAVLEIAPEIPYQEMFRSLNDKTSLKSLRAAAWAAGAIQNWENEDLRLKVAAYAVAVDPSSPIARFVYGHRLGRRQHYVEGAAQKWKAEQLASEPLKAAIRKDRVVLPNGKLRPGYDWVPDSVPTPVPEKGFEPPLPDPED
jgi:hypothetical protein